MRGAYKKYPAGRPYFWPFHSQGVQHKGKSYPRPLPTGPAKGRQNQKKRNSRHPSPHPPGRKVSTRAPASTRWHRDNTSASIPLVLRRYRTSGAPVQPSYVWRQLQAATLLFWRKSDRLSPSFPVPYFPCPAPALIHLKTSIPQALATRNDNTPFL